MAISRLHHINILTTDVDKTQRFYEDIVGLKVGPRPPFRGAGIWLYADDHPWVHISMANTTAEDDDQRIEGFGHIAFEMTDMKGLTDRLQTNSVDYQLRASPDRLLAQLFFADPNGVELEFTCPLADVEAAGLDVPPSDR